MSKAAPASLAGIKRHAKRIVSERSIKHMVALDEAAKLAGYQTFLHAKRSLEPGGHHQDQGTSAQKRRPKMTYNDFHMRTRTAWTAAVNQLASDNRTMGWTKIDDVERIIRPFLGRNLSHAHMPTGGGFDVWSVKRSREVGCLEFKFGTRSVIVVKPEGLIVERIEADPAESFVLLKLKTLEPSGVYSQERSEGFREQRVEELLEINGRYYSRDGVDDGYYIDEDGVEAELPKNWRLVVRKLAGQILTVAKGSIWNGSNHTYDGLHDNLDAGQIRDAIEQAINNRV